MTLVEGGPAHLTALEGNLSSAAVRPHNTFETSLELGFFLSPSEVTRVANEMREGPVPFFAELVVPARRLTPDTSEMSPEDKQQIRDEVNADNARRLRSIQDFFEKFLSPATAELLARKVRSQVTGFVARECLGDAYYTLIVEHDTMIKRVS